MAGERRISIKEIEAMVGADADYYNACLAEITAESEYTALYERLMVMKKMAQMRAAF